MVSGSLGRSGAAGDHRAGSRQAGRRLDLVLGGARQTKTCSRCNSVLGSRLDAALIAWCAETLYKIAIRSPFFRGHRYLRDVDLRGTHKGQFALLAGGPEHRDIRPRSSLGEPSTSPSGRTTFDASGLPL